MRLLSWIDEVVESLELGPEVNLAMTVSVTGCIVVGSRPTLEYARLVRMFKLDTHGHSFDQGPASVRTCLCAHAAPDPPRRSSRAYHHTKSKACPQVDTQPLSEVEVAEDLPQELAAIFLQ